MKFNKKLIYQHLSCCPAENTLGMLTDSILEAELDRSTNTISTTTPYHRNELNYFFHILGNTYGYDNVKKYHLQTSDLPLPNNINVPSAIDHTVLLILDHVDPNWVELGSVDYINDILGYNKAKLSSSICNLVNYIYLLYNVRLKIFSYHPNSIFSFGENKELLEVPDERPNPSVAIIYFLEQKCDKYVSREIVHYAIGHFLQEVRNFYPKVSDVVYSVTKPYNPKIVTLDRYNFKKLIGYHLQQQDYLKFSKHMDIKLIDVQLDRITFEIPLYREDLISEIDLIEELTFFKGITHKIQPNFSTKGITTRNMHPTIGSSVFMRHLCSVGYTQVINFSFNHKVDNMRFAYPSKESIVISNPLSADYSELRQSLISSLFKTLSFNVNRQCNNLHIYEIGKKFSDMAETITLSGLAYGSKNPHHWRSTQSDFYSVLGDILQVLPKNYRLERCEDIDWLDKSQSCYIFHDDKYVGILGKLSEKIMKINKLFRHDTFIFELDLDIISKKRPISLNLKRVYHSPIRDLSFKLRHHESIRSVIDTITVSPIIAKVRDISVKDIYHLPGDKKSITISIQFLNEDNNITDLIVDSYMNIINDLLKNITSN